MLASQGEVGQELGEGALRMCVCRFMTRYVADKYNAHMQNCIKCYLVDKQSLGTRWLQSPSMTISLHA
jgi:hypothetical protein